MEWPSEWEVEFTDEFEAWWDGLSEGEQEDIDAKVRLLQRVGPRLGRPYSDAFDPRRVAMLLLGGDKTGNSRWYEQFVPIADRLYDQHLDALEREGLI